MKLLERVVNVAAKSVLRILCRVDAWQLQRIPPHGPGILMLNHTSNLEGPAVYLLIQPRRTTAMGKVELWSNAFTRFFMELWGIIPISRGRVDKRAVQASLDALDRGEFLGIAPEGTRRKDGVLGDGHPGIALLASQRKVPIYPIAQTGFTDMMSSLKRFRRARIVFRVGKPFTINLPSDTRPSPAQLRQVTAELMYQLARLLPVEYRGPYGDLTKLTTNFLQFE